MSKIKETIKAATEAVSSVLGQFTGKCCDSNVFNNNDMHLSREVFEVLMDSDEYKRAMENGHYIGYLGHPADSDCQDFEHACIVMKDMRILDNGEIEGDFDLIDTPVGRIVKSFTDAGVKFGISIRGLGDVDGSGEVDPEGFIFRGFDLVTFPAYDDCIPEFKAIAASTDMKKKSQYKKICASIDANLSSISSCEALAAIQEQLPDNSEEFNKVQNRIEEISAEPLFVVEKAEDESDIAAQVANEKLEAVTELYLDAADSVRQLEAEVAELQVANNELTIECSSLKHRQARMNKIVANQINTANETADDFEAKYIKFSKKAQEASANLVEAKKELRDAKEELRATTESYNKLNEIYREQVTANRQLKLDLKKSQETCERQVLANTRLKEKLTSFRQKSKDDREAIKASDDLNLKYKMKIEANSEAISQKDSAIEDLKSQLNETVIKCKTLESKASNLDEKNGELLSRVEAAEEMVSSYQQAYANMYANALGVYLTGLPITANTSVEELTEMIKGGTSTANIGAAPVYTEIADEEYIEGEDEIFDDDVKYSAGMVTM